MFKRSFLAAAVLATVVWAGTAAHGQVMADRVPGDAVVYAGWAGTDTLGPAYDQSHLKSLLNTLNLPQWVSDSIQTEIAREGDPQHKEAVELLSEAWAIMARSPTAFYFGGMDLTGPRPYPRLAVFSRLSNPNAAAASGRSPSALAEKLATLLKRNAGPNDPPMGVVVVGDYLLLYVGDQSMEARLKGAAPADNLAANDGFKRAKVHVGAGAAPALFLYADPLAGLEVLQKTLSTVPGGLGVGVAEALPVVRNVLGLDDLGPMAWAGGFEGRNWRSAGFLAMKERRTGLLSLMDNKPLSDGAYKLIPATATSAGVFRFDGERFLVEAVNAAGRINERAPQQLEMIYQQFYAFTGVDLKKELLPPFGDEFVYYCTPDAAGNSFQGFTIVNRLKDPKKAESALKASEDFVNLLILQRSPDSKAQLRVQSLTAPLDKIQTHVISVDRFTPSWAIHEGNFYFSMSLAGLQGAIETATDARKPTILENPAFAGLRKSFGEQPISSFAFADLPRSAAESYSVINSLITRFQELDPTPPEKRYVLPPLNRIMPDLGPVLSIYWSDADGYHVRETGPFPYAGSLSPEQLLVHRLGQIMEARQNPAPGRAVPGQTLP